MFDQIHFANLIRYNVPGAIMVPLNPTETLPLETNSDGVIRIGRTRVTLETVITAFRDGATAEEIAQQYPSLQLADIYSVIGYYLRHRSEVDAYVLERAQRAEQVRQQNETRFDPSGIRDRLLALDGLARRTRQRR